MDHEPPNLSIAYQRLGLWAGMILDGTSVGLLPDADGGALELVVNVTTARNKSSSIANMLIAKADVLIA